MELTHLPRGTYVVGVSGGVDSVVLLHMLKAQQPKNQYVVAHFEHGIRGGASKDDAAFVRQLAAVEGLPYEEGYGSLGELVSEEAARRARYEFLRQVCKQWEADALILAHHQDDVLETMILNIMRGTGWRGLISLRSHPTLVRPLLDVPKVSLLEYANRHHLSWREDSTNRDVAYTRNYIRHQLVPRLLGGARQTLLDLHDKQLQVAAHLHEELTQLLPRIIQERGGWITVQRYFLIMCPENVALECLQAVMTRVHGRRIEYPQAQRLLYFAKSATPGKDWQPVGDIKVTVNRDSLVVRKL